MEAEGRRYRVQETIGKGGFGTVYKAELLGQGGFVKSVALKMLNESIAATDGMSERLRDEARMLGLLRHRAIVQVDGLLQLNGRWTIVMEYVEGVDLKQLLTRGPLPVGIAIEIIQEVANALYVAYERPATPSGPLRLLHRDIKPSNILLSVSGDVKILDFGVARAEFEAREARTQALAFGSLAYMSPERMENVNLHAGDVYALGAVLYELITAEPLGRTTGQPDDHLALVDRAMERLWDTTTDEELYQLVAECLAYNAEVRPPARELERRLRNIRRRFEEPWLSDWAENIVPGLLTEIERPQDENAGKVVLEARGFTPPGSPVQPQSAPPEPEPAAVPPTYPPSPDDDAPADEGEAQHEESDEPPPRSSVPIVLAAVLSAGLVVGMGLGAAAFVKAHRDKGAATPEITTGATEASSASSSTSNDPKGPATGTETPPTGTTAPTGTDTPPTGTDTPPTGAETPPTGAETPPTTTPPTGAETPPTTTPPTTTPPATTPPTTTPPTGGTGGGSSGGGGSGGSSVGDPVRYGQVALLGDMTGVQLVKGSRSYTSGRVPAGTYTVKATVDGAAREMGTVTVSANKTVTVTCKKGFPFCVVR